MWPRRGGHRGKYPVAKRCVWGCTTTIPPGDTRSTLFPTFALSADCKKAGVGDGCGQAGDPSESCRRGTAEPNVRLVEQEVEERGDTSSPDPSSSDPPSSATGLWGAPPAEELGDLMTDPFSHT